MIHLNDEQTIREPKGMLQESELGLVVGGFLGKEIEQAFHAATGGWRDQPIGNYRHGGFTATGSHTLR